MRCRAGLPRRGADVDHGPRYVATPPLMRATPRARAMLFRKLALLATGLALLSATACALPLQPNQTFRLGTSSPTSPAGTSGAATPSTPSPTATPRIGAAVVQSTKVILTGLEVPWAVDLAPDGRLFITERPGRVRIARFDGTTATLQPEPWTTVDARAGQNNEGGLLGLALDPQFATNGFVYLYYSYRSGNATVNRLVRMRDVNGVGIDETVLLDGVAGNVNHDGGRLKFGPDGTLYLTTGDAQVDARAQDLGNPNGKVLRLNADGSIPADDPFAGSPIWSYGHRNVQGIA